MIIILGVRVAAERVAQICGPLWGAEVLHNFYLVFLFPAIFLLVTMLLQGLSWSWLDDTLFKKGNYKTFHLRRILWIKSLQLYRGWHIRE